MSSAAWFRGKRPRRSFNTCPSKAIQTNLYAYTLQVRTCCVPSNPCATFNCVEVLMADNVGSKVSYFLVGLGVGALMGVLFAPKSGEETRDYLAKRADDGRGRSWPRSFSSRIEVVEGPLVYPAVR